MVRTIRKDSRMSKLKVTISIESELNEALIDYAAKAKTSRSQLMMQWPAH